MILELAFAVSNHLTEGNFNEEHLVARLSEGNYFGTVYHNSEDSVSFGLGYKIESNGFFGEAALVTGYEYAPVVPMLRAGYGTGNVRLWAAPSVTPEGDVFGIIGAEIYVTFGD
jgi:hypothetical protein